MRAYNVLERVVRNPVCKPITTHDLKLHADTSTAQNTVTAYGPGYVDINRVRHTTSVIVTPDTVEPWTVTDFDSLETGHFDRLAALGGEVVLLGTGARQRFPDPLLTQSVHRAGIGLEVMNTQAACRTYNILMAESRRVAAALIVED